MSFIDDVNKVRPEHVSSQEKAQMMKQAEEKELLDLVKKTATAAKSMIINSAKKVSKGTAFSFEGFILHKWPNNDTKYIHTNSSVKRSFFSSNSTQDIYFFTTENATRFLKLLKAELIKDSITLNEYKLMFCRNHMGDYPNLCISHTIGDFILVAGDSGSDLLSLNDRYSLPCTWHIGYSLGDRYDSVVVDTKKVFECRGSMNQSGIYLCLSFMFKE